MTGRLLLILLACSGVCWAQATNVVVVGTSATQALLTYTSPDNNACTLTISPTNIDLDATFYTNANLDSRTGNLGAGTASRTVVIGTVPEPSVVYDNLALDANRYSRALQANTTYTLTIACTGGNVNQAFTTQNPPLGKTYAEPYPIASAGNYAFPTVPTTVDKTKPIIDPVTGLKTVWITSATDGSGGGTLPNMVGDGAAFFCGTQTVNDGSAVPGYLCYTGTTGGAEVIYWIRTDTGESRYLGSPHLSGGVLADIPSASYLGAASAPFDYLDPTKIYGIVPGTLDLHIVKCKLPASGNSYYNASQPANSFASCTFSDLTPGGLKAAIKAYDSTFDKTIFDGAGFEGIANQYIELTARSGSGRQDHLSWAAAFDTTSNTIIGAFNIAAATSPSICRWCSFHSTHQANVNWFGFTIKYLQESGFPGGGPYTTPLNGAIDNSQTTIVVTGNPAAVLAPTSLGYNPAIGDAFNIDSEYMEITGIAGNTWTVTRHAYGTPAATHANGAAVVMQCRSFNPADASQASITWWDFVNDPHGASVVSIFDNGLADHGSFAQNSNGINGFISADSWGACWNATPGVACSNFLNITHSPAFAGYIKNASGNAYQKHPTGVHQLLATGTEAIWGNDALYMDADSDARCSSWTNVSGSLYKCVPGATLEQKKQSLLTISGQKPLLNISGAASSIGGAAGDNYKVCIVYVAGECTGGSLAGQAYLNSPDFSGASFCKYGQPVNNDDPCVSNLPSFGNAIVQMRIDRADTVGATGGKNSRILAQPFTSVQYWFAAGGEPTPDGKWIVFQTDDNARHDLRAILMPPLPADSATARNDFIQLTVTPGIVASSAHSGVEFSYDPSFTGCTQRQEVCVATASSYTPGQPTTATNPFAFETADAWTGQDCSVSCSFVIPVIPGHVVYYRTFYRTVGNATISRSATSIAIDGSSAPPGPVGNPGAARGWLP